jgi:hypothetical protein
MSHPLRKLTLADIPDVKTFLERIGRNSAKECEDKIKVSSLVCVAAERIVLESII